MTDTAQVEQYRFAGVPAPTEENPDARAPLGNDPGRVEIGTVVTVREVVAADVPGAHDDTEDAVVVEWPSPSLGTDESGAPTIVYTPRSFSVSQADFGAWFERVSG